jgi:vacuolar-type H+-ATPase subunit D/Vma8
VTDAERIMGLLERKRTGLPVRYVDVLHELADSHERAQAVLVLLVEAGQITWASNGVVRPTGRSVANG